MEILSKITIEKKVVVELPYYCKNDCFAFAVLNKNEAVKVFYSIYGSASIEVCHAGLPFEPSLGCKPCTGDEFKAIYTDALVRIDTFLNLPSLPEKQY